MRRVLLLTVIFAFVLTASSWAADISGEWTFTWWGAGAEESFPLVIKSAGENLAVTGTHPAFGEMTGTGTLKGDSVALTLKSSSMEIALTGKLAGNKMEGTREIKASGDGRGGSDPGGATGGPQGDQGGAPSGAAPQGGMSEGAGGGPGSAQGGQGAPQGGAPQQGGMPDGTGGAQAGAPQGGDQGSDAAGGNENWTAVKN